MGYTSLYSSPIKQCKTVILVKDNFGVEMTFADDEGNEHIETACFETAELQAAAGNHITVSSKEAKRA